MTVLATDDFNRANGALGANWTNLVNSFVILSNAAKPNAYGDDAVSIYSAATWPNDQYAQVNVLGIGNTALDIGPGVCLRAANANNFYRITCGTTHCDVAKVVSGSYSTITDLGAGFLPGDTLYAEIQGTTIKVFRNGVQFGTNVTDSSLSSGSAGLMYSSNASGVTVDNFEGGDFAAAGGPAPAMPSQRMLRGLGCIAVPRLWTPPRRKLVVA